MLTLNLTKIVQFSVGHQSLLTHKTINKINLILSVILQMEINEIIFVEFIYHFGLVK